MFWQDTNHDRAQQQRMLDQFQRQRQRQRSVVARTDRTQAILEQLLTGTVLKTDSTTIYADLGEQDNTSEAAAELVALSDLCPICLEDWQHGEEIKCPARCKHAYHAHCIAQWLDANTTSTSNQHSNNDNTTTATDNNNSKCPCCRSQLDGSSDNIHATTTQSSNNATATTTTSTTRPRLRLPTYDSDEIDDDNSDHHDWTSIEFRSMIRVSELDTIDGGRSDAAVAGGHRPSTPIFGHSTNVRTTTPTPPPQFALPPGSDGEGSRRSVHTDDTVVMQPEGAYRDDRDQPPSFWNSAQRQRRSATTRTTTAVVDLDDDDIVVAADSETTTTAADEPAGHNTLPLKERIRPLLDSEDGAPPVPLSQNARLLIGNHQVWDPREDSENIDHCVLCHRRFQQCGSGGRYTMSQDFECMHLYHEECLLDYACRYLVDERQDDEGGMPVIGNVAVRTVPCVCCMRPYVCVPEAILHDDGDDDDTTNSNNHNERRRRLASF